MAGFYYTAPEVAQLIGVSRGQAYQIVRTLNNELKEKGFITIPGKIPKKYLQEHYYGLDLSEAEELLKASCQ